MIKSKVYLICLVLILFFGSFNQQKEKEIHYLPLGDSYTICTGAKETESWPVLLTKHLNDQKIKTTLLTNPARNGYSTQNVIDLELPLIKKLKPNFVTLLIGVNDWVREVPTATFKKNLIYILDEIQKQIENNGKVILITIPDFGVTPTGQNFSGGRDISKGIFEFNSVIKAEGKIRGLNVVDIFEVSKKMKEDKSLVAEDGLHPSAKEYAIWEQIILPNAIKIWRP